MIMDRLFSCEVLSAIVLLLLAISLVIKEHDNKSITFFVPGFLIALLSITLSIKSYSAAFSKDAKEIYMGEAMKMVSCLSYLTEAVSLAFFGLFLKTIIFNNKNKIGNLLTAISFICVPFTLLTYLLSLNY